MLTGKELAASGMITNFDEKFVQQQGIDIRVAKIRKIKKGPMGMIPAEGKTMLPVYEDMQPLRMSNGDIHIVGWMLPVGVYEIECIEGVSVRNTCAMKPLTRSSLIRCGARVDSGLFDAGFHTNNIGAMLYVSNPIVLEVNARVAQMVCLESNDVDNLYNGQFQNDQQRETSA